MRTLLTVLGLMLIFAACEEKRPAVPEYPHIDFAKVSHLQGRWATCLDWSGLSADPLSWEYFIEVSEDRWSEGMRISADGKCQTPVLSIANISLVRDVGEEADVRNLDLALGVDAEMVIYDNELAGNYVGSDLPSMLIQMGCRIPKVGDTLSMRKDCKFIYDAEGNVIPTKSWPLPQEADYFQIYQLADANTLLLGLTEWCGVDDCESFEGQDREHRPRLIDVDVPYVKSGSNAVASEHEIVTHLAPLKVLPLEVGSRLEERLRRRGLKLPFLK